MTPDWYDLLDVPRDAEAATIRAAWKAAVADLDPTDRTFRVYSQAAEVLLDPDRRAAYDAQLAAEDEEPVAQEPVDDEPLAQEPVDDEPVAEEPVARATAGDDPVVPEAGGAAGAVRRVPGWLLAGVALLTLLVALAAGILHATAPGDPGLRPVLGELAWWDEETTSGDAAVPPGTGGALRAAEESVGPITEYDYRRLDESRDAALAVVTPEFAEKYEKLYEGAVRDNAVETQSVVTVTAVRASAIGEVRDGRVEVLVFFDREVTNKALSNPRTFEDQATLVMEEVDGRWLVADVKTTRPAE